KGPGFFTRTVSARRLALSYEGSAQCRDPLFTSSPAASSQQTPTHTPFDSTTPPTYNRAVSLTCSAGRSLRSPVAFSPTGALNRGQSDESEVDSLCNGGGVFLFRAVTPPRCPSPR